MDILDHVMRRAGLAPGAPAADDASAKYPSMLRSEGYGSLQSIVGMGRDDLEACGVTKRAHVRALLQVIDQLATGLLVNIVCEPDLIAFSRSLCSHLDIKLSPECAAVCGQTQSANCSTPNVKTAAYTVFVLSPGFFSNAQCVKTAMDVLSHDDCRWIVARLSSFGTLTRDVLLDKDIDWLSNKSTEEQEAVRKLLISPFLDWSDQSLAKDLSAERCNQAWKSLNVFRDSNYLVPARVLAKADQVDAEATASAVAHLDALLAEALLARPSPSLESMPPLSMSSTNVLIAHFASGADSGTEKRLRTTSSDSVSVAGDSSNAVVGSLTPEIFLVSSVPDELRALVDRIDSLHVVGSDSPPAGEALCHLFSQYDCATQQVRDWLFALNAPKEIFRALEFQLENVSVAKFGCGLLGNLALDDCNYGKRRKPLLETGIGLITKAMVLHVENAEVVYQCVGAMINLLRLPCTLPADHVCGELVLAVVLVLQRYCNDHEIATLSLRLLAQLAYDASFSNKISPTCISVAVDLFYEDIVVIRPGKSTASVSECAIAALYFFQNLSTSAQAAPLLVEKVHWAILFHEFYQDKCLARTVISIVWNIWCALDTSARLAFEPSVIQIVIRVLDTDSLVSDESLFSGVLGLICAAAAPGASWLEEYIEFLPEQIELLGLNPVVARFGCRVLGLVLPHSLKCTPQLVERSVDLIELLLRMHGAAESTDVCYAAVTALEQLGQPVDVESIENCFAPHFLRRRFVFHDLVHACKSLRSRKLNLRLRAEDAWRAMEILLELPSPLAAEKDSREAADIEHVEDVLLSLVAASWAQEHSNILVKMDFKSMMDFLLMRKHHRPRVLLMVVWLLRRALSSLPFRLSQVLVQSLTVVIALPHVTAHHVQAIRIGLAMSVHLASKPHYLPLFYSTGFYYVFNRELDSSTAQGGGLQTMYRGDWKRLIDHLIWRLGSVSRIEFSGNLSPVEKSALESLAVQLVQKSLTQSEALRLLRALSAKRRLLPLDVFVDFGFVLEGVAALFGSLPDVMNLLWVSLVIWSKLGMGAIVEFVEKHSEHLSSSCLFLAEVQKLGVAGADLTLLTLLLRFESHFNEDMIAAVLEIAAVSIDDGIISSCSALQMLSGVTLTTNRSSALRRALFNLAETSLLDKKALPNAPACLAYLKLCRIYQNLRLHSLESISKMHGHDDTICKIICALFGVYAAPKATEQSFIARLLVRCFQSSDLDATVTEACGALEQMAERASDGLSEECTELLLGIVDVHASDRRTEAVIQLLYHALSTSSSLDSPGLISVQILINAFIAAPTRPRLNLLAIVLSNAPVYQEISWSALQESLSSFAKSPCRGDDAAAWESLSVIEKVIEQAQDAVQSMAETLPTFESPEAAARFINSTRLGSLELSIARMISTWRRFHQNEHVVLACLQAVQSLDEFEVQSLELLRQGVMFDVLRCVSVFTRLELVQCACIAVLIRLSPPFLDCTLATIFIENANGPCTEAVASAVITEGWSYPDAQFVAKDTALVMALSKVVHVHLANHGLVERCLEVLQAAIIRGGVGGTRVTPDDARLYMVAVIGALVDVISSHDYPLAPVRVAVDILLALDQSSERKIVAESSACPALVEIIQRDATLQVNALRILCDMPALPGQCRRLLESGIVAAMVVCLDRILLPDDPRMELLVTLGKALVGAERSDVVLFQDAPRNLGGIMMANALLGSLLRIVDSDLQAAQFLGELFGKLGNSSLVESVVSDRVFLDGLVRLCDAGVFGAVQFVIACLSSASLVDLSPQLARQFVAHPMCARLFSALPSVPNLIVPALLNLAKADVGEELRAQGVVESVRAMGSNFVGKAVLLAQLEPRMVSTPFPVKPPVKQRQPQLPRPGNSSIVHISGPLANLSSSGSAAGGVPANTGSSATRVPPRLRPQGKAMSTESVTLPQLRQPRQKAAAAAAVDAVLPARSVELACSICGTEGHEEEKCPQR